MSCTLFWLPRKPKSSNSGLARKGELCDCAYRLYPSSMQALSISSRVVHSCSIPFPSVYSTYVIEALGFLSTTFLMRECVLFYWNAFFVIFSWISTDFLYFTAHFALTLYSNYFRRSSALALSCLYFILHVACACSASCRFIRSALGCCVCRVSLRIFLVSIRRPKMRVMTSSHSGISFLSFPISSEKGAFPAKFCRRPCLHFFAGRRR
jgi:hypothetical protein